MGIFGIFSKFFVKYPQKHLVTLDGILTFCRIIKVHTGQYIPGGVADNNEEELLEFGSKGGVVLLISSNSSSEEWLPPSASEVGVVTKKVGVLSVLLMVFVDAGVTSN